MVSHWCSQNIGSSVAQWCYKHLSIKHQPLEQSYAAIYNNLSNDKVNDEIIEKHLEQTGGPGASTTLAPSNDNTGNLSGNDQQVGFCFTSAMNLR